MEPTDQSINNNPVPSESSSLRQILRKKWVIALIVLLILLPLLLVSILFLSNQKGDDKPNPAVAPTPTPTVSVELQKAIDEAKESDQEYSEFQENYAADYPWIRKLPLTTEKYYIYFDLPKKSFVGRLYPKTGDNVAQMKSEIQNRLKSEMGITLQSYKVEWVVIPQ
ncbi:MAG TPA: hypothetical protein VNA13_01580 [Xanthomonadales bacterium]|nr:hypothetical protein [Xanthomonadales bacterium]